MIPTPFAPHYGSGAILSATDASQSAAISNHNEVLRICNAGPGVVCVRVGGGVQTATNKDFAIMPGQASTIRKQIGENGSNALQLGYVCPVAAATATLYVISGNGGV